MEVKATGKYIRISPTKVRDVARGVKGSDALAAASVLRFSPRSGAHALGKVLESAIANAENNFNLKKEALKVADAFVDEGPKFKRFQPRARGAANTIFRRTSHITIIVEGEEKHRKIKKAEEESKMDIEMPAKTKETEKEIKTVEQKPEKAVKEISKEKEVRAETKEKKKEENLKDLAKDRKKKQVGGEKAKEDGTTFQPEKKVKEQGGFWNKFFRRKTG